MDNNDEDARPIKTRLQLNDGLKEVVIKWLNSPEHANDLSAAESYEIYHESLAKFMETTLNLKNTKDDNLAFMILLSYSKERINAIADWSDLKFGKNDTQNNDLEPDVFIHDPDPNSHNTCICDERIRNIYTFKNRYTGIILNMGCVCVTKHKIVGEDHPKFKRLQKQSRDLTTQQKDIAQAIKEGLPENHYVQQRIKKKEESAAKKAQTAKTIQEKISVGEYVNCCCVMCAKEFVQKNIFIKQKVCSNCVSAVNKTRNMKLNNEFKKNIYLCANNDCAIECSVLINCNYTILRNFCKDCCESYEKRACKMCRNVIISEIKSKNVLCDDCDRLTKKCVDCGDPFAPKDGASYITRCYNCYQTYKESRENQCLIISHERIYLNVPYNEKDDAKQIGARWDNTLRKWYLNNNCDKVLYEKWVM